MSRLSDNHLRLDGYGRGFCSVPIWRGWMDAGFCDAEAFGTQQPNHRPVGEITHALACPAHGGPEKVRESDDAIPSESS